MARLSASPVAPGKPAADARYIYGPGKQYSTALITCLGIPERDLPAIVIAVERRLRSFDKRVYLTDAFDFSSFVNVGAPVEHFPYIEDQRKYLPDAPWSVHLRTPLVLDCPSGVQKEGLWTGLRSSRGWSVAGSGRMLRRRQCWRIPMLPARMSPR